MGVLCSRGVILDSRTGFAFLGLHVQASSTQARGSDTEEYPQACRALSSTSMESQSWEFSELSFF